MGITVRNMSSADEVREVPNGKVEVMNFKGQTVGRSTFQPGWRWSNDVKPIAGTEWCEFNHFGIIVSGRLHLVTKDGEESEVGPGDVVSVPAGHDGWVVGDEAVVMIDMDEGAADYAKPK